MRGNWVLRGAVAATLALSCTANAADAAKAASAGKSRSKQQLERGRYLVMIGGCNDCHTDGYAPSGGNVPERDWLLGSGPLGFRGPWGTTYAPNLRVTASTMTEVEWVKYAKSLKPPHAVVQRERDDRSGLAGDVSIHRRPGCSRSAGASLRPSRQAAEPAVHSVACAAEITVT